MRFSLNIEYYAILREQAGCGGEQVETSASTAAHLFEELKVRHRFTLDSQNMKVVINEYFSDWSAPLRDGDTVVFIPPVAGG